MTQVTNLAAKLGLGMTGKIGEGKDKNQDMTQAVLDQFSSIMDQNSKHMFQSFGAYQDKTDKMTGEVITGFTDKSGISEKDYVQLNKGKREIAEAKQNTASQKELSSDKRFAEKISQTAEKVQETVKDTMQVTDEDIKAAMETLGFSPIDLLDPQKLVQLAQELTGSENAGELLVNADFQVMMQEVSVVIVEFEQEYSLTPDQFTDLLAQFHDNLQEMVEDVKELLGEIDTDMTPEMELVSGEQTEGADADQMFLDKLGAMEQAAQTEETVSKVIRSDVTAEQVSAVRNDQPAAVQEVQKADTEETVQETAQIRVDLTEEAAPQAQTDTGSEGSLSQNKDEGLFSQSLDEQAAKTAEQALVSNQTVQTPVQEMPVEQIAVPQVASYEQLQQLIDQFEGLARTFASTEETTIQMQLNPENLGRLFLSVSEKQGNVTAQIAASNEQVKEALQTQLVELRATLQAQGIKVEAVEVTVATHEFEQNLDGNTSANGQMQEQAREQAAQSQTGRRNLNMNSLDGLSGLMSEEETLVAQMMRDNGGTVDFTA